MSHTGPALRLIKGAQNLGKDLRATLDPVGAAESLLGELDFRPETMIKRLPGTPQPIINEAQRCQRELHQRGSVARRGIKMGDGQIGVHAAWSMLPFLNKANPADGILETKQEGNFHLLQCWADGLRGKTATHDISYLKHTQNLTGIYSTVGSDSLQALKGTIYSFLSPKKSELKRVDQESQPIRELKNRNHYRRASEKLRVLNKRAEEGVIVERDGKQYGVSIMTYPTAPRLHGYLTDEEEFALQQDTIREMKAKHPNRKIKKINIQSVSDVWGHMNNIPGGEQIGSGIATEQYVTLVMFETEGETPTGINRIPKAGHDTFSQAMGMAPSLSASALQDRHDRDPSFWQSEEHFNTEAQRDVRRGRFASNGLGMKTITRFATPDRMGALTFYDHLWIMCNDIAEEVFIKDPDRQFNRKLRRIRQGRATQDELDGKEQDVWGGIKALMFSIKKTGMRSTDHESKDPGEGLSAEPLPSYELKLSLITRDLTMIGEGNLTPIPEADTVVQAITARYRKQLKEYGIWDGYLAPNGMRYRYLEWDGDDHRAGHQLYHEQDLFFANLVAHEFQNHPGDTEVVSCQMHFDPNDENADPGYINNRRRLWFMTWNPAYAVIGNEHKSRNWMNRYANSFYELQAQRSIDAGQQCFDGIDVEGDGSFRISYLESPAMPQNGFDKFRWMAEGEGRWMSRRYGLAWSATLIMDWCKKYPNLWPKIFSDQVFGWHNGPQQEPSIGYRFIMQGTRFDAKAKAGYVHPILRAPGIAAVEEYPMPSQMAA